MIAVYVWCESCGRYHAETFTPPYLPSVEDDFKGEAYWFNEWGVNPYDALEGYFNPEWN